MGKHGKLAVVSGIFTVLLLVHCLLTHSVGTGLLSIFMAICTIINIIKASK